MRIAIRTKVDREILENTPTVFLGVFSAQVIVLLSAQVAILNMNWELGPVSGFQRMTLLPSCDFLPATLR